MHLLTLLHRWTGGVLGLLLAVIGLSGTVLVWEESWMRLPGAQDAYAPDTAALGRAIEVAQAGGELSRITFAGELFGLHQAIYEGGGGAYIAQGGEVVDRWDSLWGRPELWLFDLHHYLFLGESGKYVTGGLGLLLLAFAITGAILWWRTRRTFRVRLWPARMTRSAIVRQHRDIGILALPMLLLSGTTGSLMVFPALEAALLAPWAGPARAAPQPPAASAVGSQTDWQAVMAAGQGAFPGAAARRLMFPAEAGAPLVLRLKQDFEWTPNGRSYAYIDPAGARLLAKDDPANGDTAEAIAETFYPLHAGKVGGFAWRMALTFGGLSLVLLGTLASWSFWFGAARAPLGRQGRALA